MTKQVRTIKDLQNHPLVDKVFKEWQPHTYDGFEYIYWLWLKDGYCFKEYQVTALNGPTIQRLCDEFNSMKITKRTDGC